MGCVGRRCLAQFGRKDVFAKGEAVGAPLGFYEVGEAGMDFFVGVMGVEYHLELSFEVGEDGMMAGAYQSVYTLEDGVVGRLLPRAVFQVTTGGQTYSVEFTLIIVGRIGHVIGVVAFQNDGAFVDYAAGILRIAFPGLAHLDTFT